MLIFKKNQTVGIDIGSYSIKVVELEHKKKEKILKNVGLAHIPPGSLVQGDIKDAEPIKNAIKGLFENLKIKNKKVVVSIPAISVITKKITLAEREDLNIEEEVRREAEQFIPYDIEEVSLDFDIMGTSYEDEIGRLEIIVAAAKKQLIEKYIRLIQESGLIPGIIDVDIFAMQNAFEMTERLDPEVCYILVDIGSETINTNVVKGDILLFTRSSLLGGDQITKRIMDEFQIDFREAEAVKFGLKELEKNKERKVREIFRETVEEWTEEIKGSIDFFYRSYPGEKIKELFLTGGSSRIKGLKEFIEEKIDIPVKKINPFSNLTVSKKIDPSYLEYISAEFSVAFGLALRTIGDK